MSKWIFQLNGFQMKSEIDFDDFWAILLMSGKDIRFKEAGDLYKEYNEKLLKKELKKLSA
ncbi:MAG: hypothetical protein ACXAC7_24225 [Candidatus Hodarchaeales archaeon]